MFSPKNLVYVLTFKRKIKYIVSTRYSIDLFMIFIYDIDPIELNML